jgi:hypothetical protein
MKNKKKLKKIIGYLYKNFRQLEIEKRDKETNLKQETQLISLNYNSYDEEVSKKFKNFVLNIIKLKDRIRIEVSKDCIYINGNLGIFRTSNYQHTKSVPINDAIEIRINKEGFSFCRNYEQTFSFEDKFIYDEIKDQIIEKSKKLNKEILIDMIDDIMVMTNLSRSSNLDEILN